MLVFDLSREQSFNNINNWLNSIDMVCMYKYDVFVSMSQNTVATDQYSVIHFYYYKHCTSSLL